MSISGIVVDNLCFIVSPGLEYWLLIGVGGLGQVLVVVSVVIAGILVIRVVCDFITQYNPSRP